MVGRSLLVRIANATSEQGIIIPDPEILSGSNVIFYARVRNAGVMQLLTYPRETVSLDGTWQAVPDQYEFFDGRAGEDLPVDTDEASEDVAFDIDDIDDIGSLSAIFHPEASSVPIRNFNIFDGRSVEIPSSWGEELPEFTHYEGWVWYVTQFASSDLGDDGRNFLRFGAVNYKADVWLNGEHLGSHEGGFTPFSFEITDEVTEGENVLVVRSDNRRYEDGIPNDSTDFFNFGGINRSVELVSVPEGYLRNFKVDTTVSDETVGIHISAWVDDPDPTGSVTVEIPELDVDIELDAGSDSAYRGEISLSRSTVELWRPSRPRLYTVILTYGEDSIEDRIGLREVTVRDNDILVNGEPVWLRGIALHEEVAGQGRALDSEDVNTRFRWLNELGCNYARLAHYPHTEAMARMADEEGILLWEEVPAYHAINFGDEDVQELYRQQLRELIQRDWNRASVVLWSIANETDHTDEVRNELLPEIVDYVRELDDSRLVTAACFVNKTDDGIVINDHLKEHLDVVGVNQYYGWYFGEADDMKEFQEDSSGPPVVISETGAGAKWGYHGDEDEHWTEEFQAEIYRKQIDAITDNEQISGVSPWILFDFRAPWRQNEYQRGFNRKGILDQHGRKKLAFHVLRDFYRSNHFENLR